MQLSSAGILQPVIGFKAISLCAVMIDPKKCEHGSIHLSSFERKVLSLLFDTSLFIQLSPLPLHFSRSLPSNVLSPATFRRITSHTSPDLRSNLPHQLASASLKLRRTAKRFFGHMRRLCAYCVLLCQENRWWEMERKEEEEERRGELYTLYLSPFSPLNHKSILAQLAREIKKRGIGLTQYSSQVSWLGNRRRSLAGSGPTDPTLSPR